MKQIGIILEDTTSLDLRDAADLLCDGPDHLCEFGLKELLSLMKRPDFRRSIKLKLPGNDPFSSIPNTEYQNAVLAWSGNPAMTIEAASPPPVSAGRMLRQDSIKQGGFELFSGLAQPCQPSV